MHDRKIIVRGKEFTLPRGLNIVALRPSGVARIIRMIEHSLWIEQGGMPFMGVITLRDGNEYWLTTKTLGNAIYWVVSRFSLGKSGKVLAAGSFRSGTLYNYEESAAAYPEVRGLGLYPTVLRYVRKFYKRPLISDRSMSIPNIKAWIIAGGVPLRTRGSFFINPRKQHWIPCFLALESVPC